MGVFIFLPLDLLGDFDEFADELDQLLLVEAVELPRVLEHGLLDVWVRESVTDAPEGEGGIYHLGVAGLLAGRKDRQQIPIGDRL